MADKRMFSKTIIGSARFLRMPPSSRLLYYDLGMYADDDGIVEAFSVMRQTSATEDDLRVLVSKGFVKVLNEDLVSYITDWNVNNSIRGDRYHASIYKDLMLQMIENDLNDNQLTTKWQPNDNQVTTNGIPRLGKVRLDKVSIGNNISPSQAKEEFETLWKMYPKKRGKKDALTKYIKARKEGTEYEEVKSGIEAYVEYIKATGRDEQYIKDGKTFFNQYAWQDDWTVTWSKNNGTRNDFGAGYGERSGVRRSEGESGYEAESLGEAGTQGGIPMANGTFPF